MQAKDIQIAGRNTHYLEAGEHNTRPLILLHGNVGDATLHWSSLIPQLVHLYHVYAPDLPGFGKTDPLPNMTFEAILDWLNGFYDALDLNIGGLVGTSYGGLITRLFASAHPTRVPAIILINGGGLPPKSGGMERTLAQLPIINNMIFGGASKKMVQSRDALNWLVEYPKKTKEDEVDLERTSAKPYTPPDTLTADMVTIAQQSADALSNLMKMQVLSAVPEKRTPMLPTLILWGEDDDISPVKVGKRIHKAIPGSEFSPIANTRHAPHIEEPDIIAFQIESFLENLSNPTQDNLPGVGRLG